MLDSGSPSTGGQIVPDYELLRRIGAGAYGEVWLARSKATGALRAAKIVWRHKFDDDRPFQREFEGIQRFEQISREHPSQLALFHIGRNDAGGYFYYVMELADDLGNPKSEVRSPKEIRDPKSEKSPGGEGRRDSGLDLGSEVGLQSSDSYVPHTLRADLAQGRLPASRVLEIGLALSEALSHLHDNGLVHRDVKPSNVIFVRGRPKLADIGLVTDASDQCSIVGTEGYLPPEGPGTPQADIFALGKVLYEAATGMDRRRFAELPEDLRQWPDHRSVIELNEIVLRACAKDSTARYSNCDEMHQELSLLQHGKSVQRKRTIESYRVAAIKTAVALSVLALIAAFIFFWPRQPSVRSDLSIYGPDSPNQEATALCEKAMLILHGDNYAEVGTAFTNLYKAISLDPNFARPYVGLVELRLREDVHVVGMPGTTLDELHNIAAQLKKLAPNLPATFVVQAALNWGDGDYLAAERCELEAIKVNPNYELGHTFYSWLLDCFGRTDEGLHELEISRKLAPSKVIVYRCFGNTYYVRRDYSNSIYWYQTTINWESHHTAAYKGLEDCYLAMGDYTNALNYFDRRADLNYDDPTAQKARIASLRRALAEGGIPGYWALQLKWSEQDTNATYYWKAQVQVRLGNTKAALDLLEKSHQARERVDGYVTPINLLDYDECWDGLRGHPRFKKLLDDLGYTRVMQPKPLR